MKIIRNLASLPDELRSGAVAIGNFDGVHLGHARIVERLLARAREAGGAALAFTFDPHPVRLLRPAEVPPPLTWTDRKAELLTELGVSAMIAYPTDEELLRLSPRDFFETIVRGQLQARAMVEGPNFRFGRGRSGNVELLGELTAAAGMTLDVVEPVMIDGAVVSSSRVRQLIAAGRIDEASRLLTRPYRIRGMVVHGAGRGVKIGFPTANIDAVDTLLPGLGVYAGRAWVGATSVPAAINIGPNPTFGEHSVKVEVHLIDWQEPLYGQPLEVDFLSRLRDIQRFPRVEELKQQLANDIQRARAAERVASDAAKMSDS